MEDRHQFIYTHVEQQIHRELAAHNYSREVYDVKDATSLEKDIIDRTTHDLKKYLDDQKFKFDYCFSMMASATVASFMVFYVLDEKVCLRLKLNNFFDHDKLSNDKHDIFQWHTISDDS